MSALLVRMIITNTDIFSDIEDVGQQIIEDNIVAVSRQMISKEASVPKANGHLNGHSNGTNGAMELDEEL